MVTEENSGMLAYAWTDGHFFPGGTRGPGIVLLKGSVTLVVRVFEYEALRRAEVVSEHGVGTVPAWTLTCDPDFKVRNGALIEK